MTLLLLALHLAQLSMAHPLEPPHVRVELASDHLILTTTHAPEALRPRFVAPCAVDPLPAPAPPSLAQPVERRFVRERWSCLPQVLTLIAAHRDPPVVVEVRAASTHIVLLDASSPSLDLDALTAAPHPFLAWLVLGAEHLIGGLDHVLLVVGLTLLIGLRRQLIFALTAFTLGHSVSLALGATQVLTLPSALVETAIAATLVVLALDLVTQRPSPFGRAPWLTGLTVGLIHGLGFAGVLLELGLPEDHQALALIAFNLGLELAQLALVAALAALLVLGRHARLTDLQPRLAHLAGWTLGVFGAAWVLERALPL